MTAVPLRGARRRQFPVSNENLWRGLDMACEPQDPGPCRVFLRWLSSRFKYSVGPNDPRGHQATSSLPARYLMASALPYDGYVPHIMAQQWLSHLCANYSLPKRTTSAPLRAY